MRSTTNTKYINATTEAVYNAFIHAEALEVWLAPDEMTGKIHNFELKEGGGYTMSLFYNEDSGTGKTGSNEDRFHSEFKELVANKKIVQAVTFESDDEAFAGEMIMEARIEPEEEGTLVTVCFHNIPEGIKEEDNEEGTRQSLEKLALLVEQKTEEF